MSSQQLSFWPLARILVRRYRAAGVPAEGVVTELHDRNLKIDGVQLWWLHYEYRDFQGRLHSGQHDLAEEDARGWKVGDVGRVLYDSSNAGEAIWLGGN